MSNNIEYGELSRRGLINMAKDFDTETEDTLKDFLNAEEQKREGKYERIRPVEKVIEQFDAAGDKISDATKENINKFFGKVEKTLPNAMNNIMDKIIVNITSSDCTLEEE